MERSILLVLTLVTLVAAIPHGYGVKGGASAKAEASAVAGAFPIGPIPLSIPSGAAYSGSFSKSSSSSFASSSASASSSSYSISGSGINGIADISGGELGQKGCSTASCPGAGSNGGQNFGGANAVASAQAKALAGSYNPCQGSKCNNSPSDKCSSGQCPTDSEKNTQNGCKTENCQSNSEMEPPSENGVSSGKDKSGEDLNDTNDFSVNINRMSPVKSAQDSSSQNTDKQNPSVSSCLDGKCGSSSSYPSNVAGKQNYHTAPATYLTTPNHNEPCTTPNCDSNPSRGYGSQAGALPSSYNVPIQSATNAPNAFYPSGNNNNGPGILTYSNEENKNIPSVPCTSLYCSPVATSNSPTYYSDQQQPKNGAPCVTGQCNTPSSNVRPTDLSHKGYTPSETPGYNGQPSCKNPNCAEPSTNGYPEGFGNQPLPENSGNQYRNTQSPLYSSPTKPTGIHGSFEITKPHKSAPVNHYNAAPTSNLGGPTGGYSRPSSSPSTLFNPTHTSGFGASPNNGIPTGSDTGSYDSHLGSNTIHGSFGVTKPNTVPNTQVPSSPTYTGGFGGLAGTVDGSSSPFGSVESHRPETANCGEAGCNKQLGSYGNHGTTPYDTTRPKPKYSGGIGGPVDPTDGPGAAPESYKPGASNCGSSGCNGQPNSYGNTGTTPYDTKTKPAYTGGFGGPAGHLDGSSSTPGSYKPGASNCGPTGCKGHPDSYGNTGTTPYDTTKTKPAYTGGFGGPAGPLDGLSSTPGSYNPGTSNCGPTGCKGHPDSYGNTGTTPYDTTKTKPAYTGGFGGPAGPLDGLSSTPGSYNPGTSNCGPTGCKGHPDSYGNTGTTPYDTTKMKPAYTGGFGGPAGPLDGLSSTPGSYNPGATNTATSSQTKPTYTGGFGGPTGTLASSTTFGSNGAHKPSTANCGSAGCNEHPDSGENAGSKPFDTTKPKPTYTGGFGGPTSPTVGASSIHDKTNSNTASSSQTKPAYTGGFGGPSGFLKPNDFSFPSSSLSENAACSSGYCGPKGSPASNYNQGHSSQGLASATASANAVAYSGGFGGPPGLLKPFDDEKGNSPGHESLGGAKSPGNGAPSTDAKNSGAHAIASATASAGSYVGSNNEKNGNGASGGCNSGCSNNGLHGADGGSLGTPNASAIASAKSIAGANSFGFGGSFASSSASAHATAGSATKGGYGRK